MSDISSEDHDLAPHTPSIIIRLITKYKYVGTSVVLADNNEKCYNQDAMLSENKTFQTSDNIHIFYNIHRGSKTKPFVVFIHGLGGDLAAWNEERRYFHERDYPTLALDLRGHGLSGHAASSGGYAFPRLSADVFEILKEEKINKPVIVGHCFGGMISIHLEALHGVAERLVLVDTNYKAPHLSSLVADHTIIKKVFSIIAHHAPTTHISGRRDFQKFKGTGDYDIRRILSDVAHTSLRTHMLFSLQIMNTDAVSLLRKIRIPVLVVVGSEDKIFPPDAARDLSNRISHSEIVIIPNANHILVLNNPASLSETIEKYIASKVGT